MVRLRIVCPWSSPAKPRTMPVPLRRQSSLSTQSGSNLARYFSVAFFIFAATTYLVFSLDMLMVPDEEPVSHSSRRRMEDNPWTFSSFEQHRERLKSIPDSVAAEAGMGSSLANDALTVLAEEDLEAIALEKEHAEEDMQVQQKAAGSLRGNGGSNVDSFIEREDDDDFANGLNSIGLAMQDQQQQSKPSEQISSANDNTNVGNKQQKPEPPAAPIIEAVESGMDEMEEPPQPEDEEDEEEMDAGAAVTLALNQLTAGANKGSDPLNAKRLSRDEDDDTRPLIPSSEWRRIHTCKYGRSEKSPTIAYGTWVWRHKKGAVLHDDYTKTPSESKLRHLRSALRLLLGREERQPDMRNVASLASEAGYTLCKIDLEDSMVVAWQPRLRGDALFFTRHAVSAATANRAVTDMIVEVPHALYDHTLHQGLHVFSETKARALILSESHRCSRSLPNKCTGNDGEPIRNLCSSSSSKAASYHNADVAHAVQTTFHAVHEVLAEDAPASALFVSLHATRSEDFIVSDGTSNAVTPSAPVANFVKQLASNLPQSKVSLCNEFDWSLGGSPPNLGTVAEDKRYVCGATNVQGRHLNGASDPCRAKVNRHGSELRSSGRFLHIEQPVTLVVPIDSKSTKPVMSKPLSEALLVALAARKADIEMPSR